MTTKSLKGIQILKPLLQANSLFDWKVLGENSRRFRKFLRHTWTLTQIASQFTGRNTQKKLDAISENLDSFACAKGDRLEWFGLIIHRKESGITPNNNKQLEQLRSKTQ